jgi:hypothetical protein
VGVGLKVLKLLHADNPAQKSPARMAKMKDREDDEREGRGMSHL